MEALPGSFAYILKKVKKMLTIDQKRSLGIRLGIMEEEVNLLRRLLRTGEEENLFSRITDDLTEEEKLLLEEKMDFLTEHLTCLKNFFDLRHSQKDLTLRGMAKAILVYLMVHLEGGMSSRLKGYGEVHTGLKESLDPKLKEMISILEEMETRI